ncbi:MAG: IclR family transcriptional regulator [Clostridia bacterium]|nr:IclR family transcriptional regulator [Clostridia bacterium]
MSQSLERGLDALLFLSTRKSVGVTELAKELTINKSTAFRILETLQRYNMAEKNKETSKYKLGPAILKLSQQLYKNLNIISAARPLMTAYSAEVGEAVHLCILSNDSAVIIEQVMTDSRITVNAKVGKREPLHASSVGKCLWAFSEMEIKEKLLSSINYEKFTERTIVEADAMRKELDKIRETGYAVDDLELSEEIRCVAAPVFNHNGEALYAIGISGPAYRLKDQRLEAVASGLKAVAIKISEQLGYSN